MSFFSSRDAVTTHLCPHCGAALHIARTCHEVYMRCPDCGKRFPLSEYIERADEAMERFLESVYLDRI
ncbi:MAG: hypothetical protein IJU37_10205 [Desulfovibrio sp.]|nr:hypothetical protein [Desulfovibrio sp.]